MKTWNDDWGDAWTHWLRKRMNEFQVPGMAIAVVHKGEILCYDGLGATDPQGNPVTPDTRGLSGW